MHFAFLVKKFEKINLKKSHFLFIHKRSFTDLPIRMILFEAWKMVPYYLLTYNKRSL